MTDNEKLQYIIKKFIENPQNDSPIQFVKKNWIKVSKYIYKSPDETSYYDIRTNI